MAGGVGGGVGMANLADELGDAWGSDVEDEAEDGFEEGVDGSNAGDTSYREDSAELSFHAESANEDSVTGLTNGVHNSLSHKNHEVTEGSSWDSAGSPNVKGKRQNGRSRSNTTASRPENVIDTISETDGGWRGANGDDDNNNGDEAFWLELDARLAEVHELAEAGTALVGEEGGAVVRRMLGRLQGLNSQSGMDGAVTW